MNTMYVPSCMGMPPLIACPPVHVMGMHSSPPLPSYTSLTSAPSHGGYPVRSCHRGQILCIQLHNRLKLEVFLSNTI